MSAHPNVADERVQQCMAGATESLQSLCVARNITLAPDLASDLVLLLASKELSVWEAIATAKKMTAELKHEQDETMDRMAYAFRAIDFATKVRRHWLMKFCPVCWVWTGLLWCLGVRGPTMADADRVRGE